jgi:hypothetical protein
MLLRTVPTFNRRSQDLSPMTWASVSRHPADICRKPMLSPFSSEGRDQYVLHEGGQSREWLIVPRCSLQPTPASREKVQDPMPVRVAALVHAEDRRMAAEAGDLPGQSIASRYTPPEPTDARASCAHEAGHHRLRNSEFPLNLLPSRKPTSP